MTDEYRTYTRLVIRHQMGHDGDDNPTEEEEG